MSRDRSRDPLPRSHTAAAAMLPCCHTMTPDLPRMQIQRFVVLGVMAAAFVGCKPGSSDGSDGKDGKTAKGPKGDPNAIQLPILYGSEKKTWLDEQIKAFNAS